MIGKQNKSVKKLVCAGIIGLALAGGVKEARADTHEHYFPLNVGNSWTYIDCNDASTKTFTIIGVEKINGHIYYKFDDYFNVGTGGSGWTIGSEVLFRYEPGVDAILMYMNGEDIIRYNFAGGGWNMANQWCRLKQSGVDCNVPAGEFSDCINFQFGGFDAGPDCYACGEYTAPDVGNVKYVVPGGECYDTEKKEGDTVTFELQSYAVYPHGDLNYDCRVDFCDFGIFAAYWRECTAPECGVQVTDVKIIRGELVEGWFEKIEEVNEVSVGYVFVIEIEVSNLGSETEHVLTLYDWDLSPQNRVEVIGTPGLCLTYIELEPRESAFLYPFCLSQAFRAKEDGCLTMNIYVIDWESGRLCEHRFTFEILPGK